jgi:ribosome biogenesis GTPase / thiamine phosphate phosphatase
VSLANLGWGDFFASRFAEHEAAGLRPGRVLYREKHRCLMHDGSSELAAELSGRFRHEAEQHNRFPAVGDWVAFQPHSDARAIIQALLPRRTCLSRKDPGERTAEQIIAANLDTVFLVAGLGQEFNPRRIERYVAGMLGSGATPVVILNKTDVCPDPAAEIARLGPVAAGIAVHAVSAIAGTGLDALKAYLRPGETVAFVGSSGVGKSSIINRLLGTDRQETGEIRRSDGRGRHITTRRELIPIPAGGLLMDTPGLRQLQLWDDEQDLETAFDDVDALANQCRFRDCGHNEEPGCAVRAALKTGTLAPERFRSYEKLLGELRLLAKRQRTAGPKKHHPRPDSPDSTGLDQ